MEKTDTQISSELSRGILSSVKEKKIDMLLDFRDVLQLF